MTSHESKLAVNNEGDTIFNIKGEVLIKLDKDQNITYLHPNILSSLSRLLLTHLRKRAWNVPMSEEWTEDQ